MKMRFRVALALSSLVALATCVDVAWGASNVVGWSGTPGYGQCTAPSGTYKQVSAGTDWSVGIRADDTLAAWGVN